MHRVGRARFVLVLLLMTPLGLMRTSSVAAYGHVTYHGGQVAATSTTYAIFWLPAGQHLEPGGDDARFESAIEGYFKDVGGTPYYKVLTQYSRDKHGHTVKGGPIRNRSTFGGAYVDTTPYPHAGTEADPLRGADFRDAVTRAMTANSWTGGITHQFFVYTATDVQVCDLPTTVFAGVQLGARPCTFDSVTTLNLCADRDYFKQGGKPILYAILPGVSVGCDFDPNLGPSRDPRLDAATYSTSVFQLDMVADPLGKGWYHTSMLLGSVGTCDPATVTLHGHAYLVAAPWSNKHSRCVTRYPTPKAQSSSGLVTYHNGSVMPSATTYAIYWLPQGAHFESDGSDSRYEGLMNRFLTDVGGTPYYNILTQYSTDGTGSTVKNGPIANSSTFGGTYVDTTQYPRAGTANSPLEDADIQAEVARAMQANGWSPGLNRMYFVFLGAGINVCQNSPESCTFTSNFPFCAYHSSFTARNGPVLYGLETDLSTLDMCRNYHLADPSPNGDVAADSTIWLLAHELFEAVTDPMVFGWRDDGGGPNGSEIGDKCQRDSGNPDKDNANVTLHGHRYLVQSEWSNATKSCVFGYP